MGSLRSAHKNMRHRSKGYLMNETIIQNTSSDFNFNFDAN